jgi:gas vesicle protein
MSKEETSGGSFIAGFAIGAMMGAAVALLYAPGPGEETRRRLTETARETRERARAAARRGSELLRKGREDLADAVDQGVDAFDKARRESL